MSRTPFAFACPRFGAGLPIAVGLAAALGLLVASPASAHHAKRPHVPQPMRVVTTTPTSIALSWTRTAARFTVSKNRHRVATTRRTRYTFTNLRCGRGYHLGVRALTRSGKRSAVVARRVRTRPCAPPSASSPVSTQTPWVTGTARAGNLVSANRGSWTGTAPIAYAYQWLRCDAAGESCSNISDATAQSYFVDNADVGARLRVRVTASNAHGSASATSGPTQVVTVDGGGGACSRADATGCAAVAGSKISLLNQRFSCRGSLAQLAAENPIGPGPGTLPLLVEVRFTTHLDLDPAVIELRDTCFGDGDDETIDLVIDVEGDGRTIGGRSDGIKVRLDPHDIQLTGHLDCGPRGIGPDGVPNSIDDAHQDGAQIQGGHKIEFIDFEWGDWETGTATCQGAAGTFVPGSVNGHPVTDMACIRCKSVSCNHGMLFSGSTGTLVVDSMWRTGNPADRMGVLANGQIGLCQYGTNPCLIDETKASSYTVLRNYCDRWPYEDPLG